MQLCHFHQRKTINRYLTRNPKLDIAIDLQILENFTSEDLNGISSVRNYIAHDYDSTDDNIIEDVVRYNLPIFKSIIEKLLKDAQ